MDCKTDRRRGISLPETCEEWHEVVAEDLGPFGSEREGRFEDANHTNDVRHVPQMGRPLTERNPGSKSAEIENQM